MLLPSLGLVADGMGKTQVTAGFLFVAGALMGALISVSKEAAAEALEEGATAAT